MLLLCFSVQLTGYHLYFRYQQMDIKRAAKRKLRKGVDPALTQIFNFPLTAANPDELPEWVDKHEFRYQGEMYDVIEKKVTGDRLIIRCLNDKKEKELLGHYKDLVKNDFGERNKKGLSLFIKLLKVSPVSPASLIAPVSVFHSAFKADMRRFRLSGTPADVLTPPPQTL